MWVTYVFADGIIVTDDITAYLYDGYNWHTVPVQTDWENTAYYVDHEELFRVDIDKYLNHELVDGRLRSTPVYLPILHLIFMADEEYDNHCVDDYEKLLVINPTLTKLINPMNDYLDTNGDLAGVASVTAQLSEQIIIRINDIISPYSYGLNTDEYIAFIKYAPSLIHTRIISATTIVEIMKLDTNGDYLQYIKWALDYGVRFGHTDNVNDIVEDLIFYDNAYRQRIPNWDEKLKYVLSLFRVNQQDLHKLRLTPNERLRYKQLINI